MPSGPASLDGVGRLLVSCTDQPGIVAALSRFLRDRGANIEQSDQHTTDPEGGAFFMRTEFRLDGVEREADAFEQAFAAEVAEPFGMDWRMHYAARRKRVAILVSRYDHCLAELLWRWRRGELYADIPLVVSNHPELAAEAGRFGVPFEHVPVEPGAKPAAEAALLELLGGAFDLIVLARYMQILSPAFLGAVAHADHQHPPLVPAGLRGGRSLRARVRARREDHRRDRALRDRGARRRARSSSRTSRA